MWRSKKGKYIIMLYNYFIQFKRDMLIDIEENGIEEKSMIMWIDRFNLLPSTCTIYCGDGIISEEEREDWRKNIQESLDKSGENLIVEIPKLRHPYIAFVLDYGVPFLEEWKDIEGIKYCPTDVGSEEEDFTFGIRRSTFVKKRFDYFFHFPTGKNFDEKMKKVYYKLMEILIENDE
jgi:hypothetical protein